MVSDKMVETLTSLLGMVTTWVAGNFLNPPPLPQKWEALESATATATATPQIKSIGLSLTTFTRKETKTEW